MQHTVASLFFSPRLPCLSFCLDPFENCAERKDITSNGEIGDIAARARIDEYGFSRDAVYRK